MLLHRAVMRVLDRRLAEGSDGRSTADMAVWP
jgi:hypothetical protein